MSNAKPIAWVTGAGKGIGRALALRLADEGWIVAASSRTPSDLASLQAAARSGTIHPYPLDVVDARRTAEVVAAIERDLGPIALAVLNAGTYVPTRAVPFDAAAYRHQFEVNVFGAVNGLAALVPLFVARRAGHIGVMASVAGYRGLPGAGAYGATKAALINMCEALRVELEPHGVGISAICPGFVKTPLTDRNDFPMPFIISAEAAAGHIVRGLAAKRFAIAFPPLFATIMMTLRLLPDRLFFALARRARR